MDATLKKAASRLQEIKREEMVEELKPKLRRETFENSEMLSRVVERPLLLLLLVVVQVLRKMLMLKLKLLMFSSSIQTIDLFQVLSVGLL